jgi:hypothetical protein
MITTVLQCVEHKTLYVHAPLRLRMMVKLFYHFLLIALNSYKCMVTVSLLLETNTDA